jgi:hypothetical protein
MKSNLLIVLVTLALFGCSGPKDTVVPTDIAKWETELKSSIEKLTEEDKKLFLGFVMRAKLGEVFGGKGLEEGLTIGKAIEKQKAWIEEQGQKEAEAKLLKQKLEAERAWAENLTGPQNNAVRSAKQYLNSQGFSRNGLIHQLSSDAGDGYKVADATVAVDSLNIDWNKEAVISAKQYLNSQGFSCKSLIRQLSSSAGGRYTVNQATYGARQAGACQ